jgi:T5orf172 domain
MSGYVYVLVNASLPGLVKIGRTDRDPFARAEALRTTGVPTPFQVLATFYVDDPAGTERQIHQRLDAVREDAGREFFRLDAGAAVQRVWEVVAPHLGQASLGTATAGPVQPADSYDEAVALCGTGPTANPAAGLAMMERLAKRKHPEANLYLARRNVAHDVILRTGAATTRKQLAIAAAAGSGDAMRILGFSTYAGRSAG